MRIGTDLDDTLIDHTENRLIAKGDKALLYGELSLQAPPLKNAIEILLKLKAEGHEITIISRRVPAGRPFAIKWISKHISWFQQEKIIFTTTDEEKSAICSSLGLDIFIDDSAKVLAHITPPTKTILFNGNKNTETSPFAKMNSWEELPHLL